MLKYLPPTNRYKVNPVIWLGLFLYVSFSSSAWALSLGEIEVKSALNQPLNAEVMLRNLKSGDLEALRITLASDEAFERSGLQRSAIINNIRFKILKASAVGDTARVRLTTRQLVKEPFLSFLVEANWPEGKLLREYTVFLDPPVQADYQAVERQSEPVVIDEPVRKFPIIENPPKNPPAQPRRNTAPPPRPVQAPTVETAPALPLPPVAAQPAPRRRSVDLAPSSGYVLGTGIPGLSEQLEAESNQPQAVRPVESRARDFSQRYGPVKRDETLWSIAFATRPDTAGITMDQMQLAIFKANPAAFDGNMNRMLKGVTLRIPDLEEIRAINKVHARAEVQRHKSGSGIATASSSNKATRAPAPAKKATKKAAQKPEIVAETDPEPLVDPEPEMVDVDQQDNGAGDEAGVAQTSDGQPSQQDIDEAVLAAAAAAADTSSDQPAEENGEREAMAALEQMLDEDPAMDSETEVAAVDGELVDPEAGYVDEEGATGTEAGLVDVDESGGEVVWDDSQSSSASIYADTSAGDSGSSTGFNPLLLIAAGVLILLLSGLFWWNRKRQNALADKEFEQYLGTEASLPDPDMSVEVVDTDEVEHHSLADSLQDTHANDNTVTGTADAGTDELISEVDMHLAYGLHDECIQMLNQALEADPGRNELRLKLMEVYQAAGRKDDFIRTAEELHQRTGDDHTDWQKAKAMGAGFAADAALFGGTTVAAASAADELARDDEVADTGQESESLSQTESTPDEALVMPEVVPDEQPDTAADPVPSTLTDAEALDQQIDAVDASTDSELESEAEAASEGSLDFNLDSLETEETPVQQPAVEAADLNIDEGLEFDFSELESSVGSEPEVSETDQDAAAESTEDALDFDMDSLEASAASSAEAVHDSADMPGADTEGLDMGLDDFATDSSDVTEDAAGLETSLDDDLSVADAGSTDVELSEGDYDEAATKLDLARAYLDMGEPSMAETLLKEVMESGNPEQQSEAQSLLNQ